MSEPIVIIDPTDIDTIVIIQENKSQTISMSGGVITETVVSPSSQSTIEVRPIVPDNVMVVCCDDNLPPPELSGGIILTSVACDISVYVGAAVYLNSSGVAQNAISTSLGTSNVLGIVESKESSVLCTVRVLGVSGEIYTNLDVTLEYYLSDTVAGQITTSTIGPGHVIIKLGQPYSEKRFLMVKGIPTVLS